MHRKTKCIICGSTVALALLMAVSAPHIGQKHITQPQISPVSAFLQADGAIPPPEPSPTLVSEKTANAEPDGTPPTEIAFEPQKPNATTEILTAQEPPRDKPTPEPLPIKNTASATATELQMGDTRNADGQKQVYFLGFGWIEDNDEPNIGVTVDGDGDINKMVGTMD